MCNHDCLNCTFEDCINDSITQSDRKEQDIRDTETIGSRKYGRALVMWRYEQSEKGKKRQKRYAESEKGKARDKRKQEKRIASGKNAEYCRAYYQRKKLEKAEQKKIG